MLKVLGVDDDLSVHQLLGSAFSKKGHSYLFGLTGKDAFDIFENGGFDVVITDLKLPDMKGIEICREIRRKPENSGIILIVVSAFLHDVDKFRRFTAELNIDFIIQKPFDAVTMVDMLSAFIIHQESQKKADKKTDEFQELRKGYVDNFPRILGDMKSAIGKILASGGDGETLEQLQDLAHKIHGSAGMFGLKELGETAGEWESAIHEYMLSGSVGGQKSALIDFIDISADFHLKLERNLRKCASGAGPEPETGCLVKLGGTGVCITDSNKYELSLKQNRKNEKGSTLIVDDDPAVQRMLAYALKTRGYSYEIIADGDEARKRIMDSDDDMLPGLMILDINLPGTDGFTLLHEFQESGKLKKMNVCVLSSHSSEDDMTKAFSYGATDYVSKPFSIPVLMYRIQRAFERCSYSADN